ncbi:hypothetical protein QVD17_03576 [Tagetes erecta]|uniref:Glutathione S-transferase n=1 Tax=Tagetes erecta TaxID=13708 RepID=A0AAD8P8T2_TARER|nr:hypothetical protein QVD17_03576 [Tagetes erecta]
MSTRKCEMKLIGARGSPFVSRVKLVLKLKSIDYEYVEEDLLNKSELLLTLSPAFQKVPVLIHGNQPPIIESLAIMEYLDEIQPHNHPLLPSNPSDRAQCRNLAYTFDTLLYTWMKEFMVTRDEARREELKQPINGGFVLLEEAFVKFSKGKPFLGGDDIGYLDIVVGVFLGWLKLYEKLFNVSFIEEDIHPRLAEWGKRMWSLEVVTSVIPTQETHMEFLNMLRALLPPLPDRAS